MRFDAIDSGPALSPTEVDAYCETHGLALPASLRNQLLDQSGGAPRKDLSVPLPGGDETDIFSVFGLEMREPASELAWIADTYAGRIPSELVPFANDSGGNLFLVGADNRVWFWDHEREGSEVAASPISESLDSLLGVLAR